VDLPENFIKIRPQPLKLSCAKNHKTNKQICTTICSYFIAMHAACDLVMWSSPCCDLWPVRQNKCSFWQ